MHDRRRTATSPLLLGLGAALARPRPLASAEGEGLTLTLLRGEDRLWLLARQGEAALFALQGPLFLGGRGQVRKLRPRSGEAIRVRVESPAGRQDWSAAIHPGAIPIVAVEHALTPAEPLHLPYLDRDLVMLEPDGTPGGRGRVEAAQRGMNAGLCFVQLGKPGPFSNLMYWQDLTALNPYFLATGTKPDGAVGGAWPELGFRLPTPSHDDSAPKPLPAGEQLCLSRAFVALHQGTDHDETGGAERFLALYAAIYPHLERPRPEMRDWPGRAERALRDLARGKGVNTIHYGHRYLHPYTAAEHPDSMAQSTVVAALLDWRDWTGKPVELADTLAAGIGKFYDPKLKTLRRYLPDVGKDKDRDEVDSWYLYYPLLKLGRLGIGGDKRARRLFEKSLDFAIRAAKHFDYKWPITFRIDDFSVKTPARDDQGHGQTDVGGLYAYVMTLAFELTDDPRYLDEARAGLDAARGMRFNLNYQANLTAWGAAAAIRLWRITQEKPYLGLSLVYLASFFHNTVAWESKIGHARRYSNFLGVTVLHDASYMAAYECIESFAAFERCLIDGGDALPGSARLLLDEYCRYAADRAWFYYPDALPKEAIADKQRNGHVDRELSLPFEDLYFDGQQAGQVGQEIYGAGAPFVYASRLFHDFPGAPFRLYCDSFVTDASSPRPGALRLNLAGSGLAEARVALLPTGREPPKVRIERVGEGPVRLRRPDGRLEAFVPGNAELEIVW